MELRQLEYFLAVAEEANFTRAAQRVHISQSGVSAQIKQLERELGAELIDRSGRTARLTPAGRAALEHARSALRAARDLRAAVDEVGGVVRGELTVGMVRACTVAPFFDALAAFRQARPGVALCLEEDDSDELIAAVRGKTADAALVAVADSCPDDLESFEIVRERLVALVPPGHPLAADGGAGGEDGGVTLGHLAEQRLVCLPQGTGIRAAFDRSSAAHDVRAQVTLQAGAPATVADLARRGLGVAILSESTAAPHTDLRTLRIADADVPAVLAMVWSGTANPALAELLGHCRRSFARPGESG